MIRSAASPETPTAGPTGAARPSRAVWWAAVAAAVVVIIVVAAVINGAGGAPAPVGQTIASSTTWEPPLDRAERLVTDILTRRSSAVLKGDEQAWLADVDPGDPEVLALERVRFRNWQQLRPVKFDLLYNSASPLTLPPSGQPSGAVVSRHTVHLVMQMEADVALNRADYTYTVALTGDAARVVDVAHLSHDSPDADRKRFGDPVFDAPWDTVPLRSARQGSVTVLAPENSRWDPAAYVGAAARAETFVRSLWAQRRAPGGFVILLADDREFIQWFGYGRTESAEGVAGYINCAEISAANGTPKDVILGDDSKAGCRAVLRMSTVRNDHEAYTLMVHELAHAIGPYLMTDVYFGGDREWLNKPTWAIEGFAEWAENLAGGDAEIRQGTDLVKRHWAKYRPSESDLAIPLPLNQDFFTTDATRNTFNYELSATFFRAVEQTGGRQKAVDLYVKLATSSELVTDTRLFLDPVIREHGIDPDRLWQTHQDVIG
ncbi:hypothetical protein ACI2K4_09460 [Micromonospora sp. NPDC050397]|uniref:hypothetical protein n=1 Tax=Micromonospora sp. NPDC050397 TaxID=3364279 RepID=UPI0038510061